jgi:hypothetical protein
MKYTIPVAAVLVALAFLVVVPTSYVCAQQPFMAYGSNGGYAGGGAYSGTYGSNGGYGGVYNGGGTYGSNGGYGGVYNGGGGTYGSNGGYGGVYNGGGTYNGAGAYSGAYSAAPSYGAYREVYRQRPTGAVVYRSRGVTANGGYAGGYTGGYTGGYAGGYTGSYGSLQYVNGVCVNCY